MNLPTMDLVFCSLLVVLVESNNALNVGTTLYHFGDLKRKWTDDDVLQLQCRILADHLLPKTVSNGDAFLKYLRLIKDKLQTISNDVTRRKMMLAMADVVGGYMQGELLGQVKRVYYEGRVGFTTVNELYQTMETIKYTLNTDGRGWLKPQSVTCNTPEIIDYTGGYSSECNQLHIVDGEVSVPEFDDEISPGSLALPFVEAQIYSVDSSYESQLLFRYFLLAMRCTTNAAGFRNDLGYWLESAVVPLLGQDRWYPILTGVLRLAESVNVFDKPEETFESTTVHTGDDRLPDRELFDFWSADESTSGNDHKIKKTGGRHKRMPNHDWRGPPDERRPKPFLEPHFTDETLCDKANLVPNSNLFSLAALVVLLFSWVFVGLLHIDKLIRSGLKLFGIF